MTTTNLTEEKITTIFESHGSYIRRIDDKGDSHYGMTLTFNKEDSVHYFHSFNGAYDYFLKMNWLF